MEITKPPRNRFKELFLKEPLPFSAKRELNWVFIKRLAIGITLASIVGLLLIPNSPPEQATYQEQAETGRVRTVGSDPSLEALAQFQQGRANLNARSPPYDSRATVNSGGARNRNSSMVVTRGGLDSRTQLPPGSRIRVKILERAVVSSQPMPVIGIVSGDFVHEDSVAIGEGAKLYGEASFDESADRAQIVWKSILLDGRERPFSAIGVASDGQAGVKGTIHSHALKNTVGQVLTRFVSAYAEGSMQKGAFGGGPGGHDNGMKNAFADVAKDRADAFAEGLKKEKRWIELGAGSEFFAVLNQQFTFRDPGGYLR